VRSKIVEKNHRKMTKTLSLFELNSLVADVINTTMSRSYWVEAELSEVRENRGHCYMELIEKNENSNVPIARASAKCWSNIWSAIKPYFIRITGQQIRAGMKVMLQVHAQFHPQYGFSWIVDDINPEYTMGDMMRKRQEIIRQLKEEGVYDLQKELNLPLFAQRIAVISSATAAGYGDFCNQLENNELGLFFHVELFPAIMQGDNVESSIIASLNHINNREEEFDCVVIIRGGGATADLSGFDTLGLAENVANFPLPIITGIGHERDESILDMVSYQRVKTPTAAAAYLINHLTSTLIRVENAQSTIIDYVKKALEIENMRIKHIGAQIPVLFSIVRTKQEARLESLFQRLFTASKELMKQSDFLLLSLQQRVQPAVRGRLSSEHHRLDVLEHRARLLDPTLLLKRGYSITLHDGKAIHNANDLKIGDTITTLLEIGQIESIVEKPS
jgi:exodeoxyribonuclease VII, large subunit